MFYIIHCLAPSGNFEIIIQALLSDSFYMHLARDYLTHESCTKINTERQISWRAAHSDDNVIKMIRHRNPRWLLVREMKSITLQPIFSSMLNLKMCFQTRSAATLPKSVFAKCFFPSNFHFSEKKNRSSCVLNIYPHLRILMTK